MANQASQPTQQPPAHRHHTSHASIASSSPASPTPKGFYPDTVPTLTTSDQVVVSGWTTTHPDTIDIILLCPLTQVEDTDRTPPDTVVSPSSPTTPVSSLLPVHKANLASINNVNAFENTSMTPVDKFTFSATPSGVVHSSDTVSSDVLHSTYQPGFPAPFGKSKSTKPLSVPCSHNSTSVNQGRWTGQTLLELSQTASNSHVIGFVLFNGTLTRPPPANNNASVISSALLGPTKQSSIALHFLSDAAPATDFSFSSNSSPLDSDNTVVVTSVPFTAQNANKNVVAEADDATAIALIARTASNAAPTPTNRNRFMILI